MKYTQPRDDRYYAQYIPSCGSLQKSESHTVYEVQPMTAGERFWRYTRQKAFNFGLFLLAVAALLLIFSIKANAQVPQEVQAMNSLPNAAQLYLVYCAANQKICVTRFASCYGQCADQYMADSMGYRCSGDIVGTIPPFFHYARWFAVDFQTGKKINGIATRNYSCK